MRTPPQAENTTNEHLDCTGRDDVTTGNALDGKDDGSGIVVPTTGPFVLVFNADKNPGLLQNANTQSNKEARNELGFSLEYKVVTSCSDLNFVTA